MVLSTKRKLIYFGSFILGFGFMGALDGIIFHQLLQWHSVIMNTDRPGQIVSDGLFHFAVTVTLVVGAIILWVGGNPMEHKRGLRVLIGGFLLGAGIFNLVEGIVDHHLLQIHHVKPGDPHELAYDLGFLAIGLLLAIIGYVLQRNQKESIHTAKV